MKLSIWPFFILLVCAQLIVPGSMIWKKDMILVKGKSYKFLTAPIDPYDPFIGKYIVLNFREEAYTLPPKQDVDDDAPVYITFRNNRPAGCCCIKVSCIFLFPIVHKADKVFLIIFACWLISISHHAK